RNPTAILENAVICAIVENIQHGGHTSLSRAKEYVKLERGQLLKIPRYLVMRGKKHFHHLDEYGVDLILGCNGFIWIGEHEVEDQVNESYPQNTHSGSLLNSGKKKTSTPLEKRQYICRIANAIRVFSAFGFMVSVEDVKETVDLRLSLGYGVYEMLGAEFHYKVADKKLLRKNFLKKRRIV
uniref:Exosome complex component RRP4 homolog n=1 Tax=Nicotiana tabacum TaxID=4097 RepID=A0A1S3ZIF1_TOBAC